MQKLSHIALSLALRSACCMALALTVSTARAQDSSFDLSSQRGELQQVARVPGEKVLHHGWMVNPTPQQMNMDTTQWLDLKRGVKLMKRAKEFAVELSWISQEKDGVRLYVDYGSKQAARAGVKPLDGAYLLQTDKKGIHITAYNERGAFYAIQTLRQLLQSDRSQGQRLPLLTINDFPSLPERGVVEGFYGTPWSHGVRLSLIDFYGRNKLNTYYYGPKDDPYHSSPNWRLPYPTQQAEQIKELIGSCQRNRVDFVWAIHPGKDIKWNEEDYHNLVQKFEWMYQLGVRHFAIFFDDISGEGTNPLRQTELLNRLTREFVKAKGDVGPLTVCPTDYSRLWANPTEQGALSIYGKTLLPGIKVYWTGDVVCSDLTPETMSFINQRIKRPALFWWNYPVTDYCRNYLLQGPVYGLDTSLTKDQLCGIISNPMEHGEASKLALYGVADYGWNTAAYNAMDNWERGLQLLAPNAAQSYRTFAIHSADTETGYRRDESWETRTFRLAEWDDAAAKQLNNDFAQLATVYQGMRKNCDNVTLLNELRPWLEQAELLGKRGQAVIALMRTFRQGATPELFWQDYVQTAMDSTQRAQYDAHKVGTMKLQPFCDEAMDDMGHLFLQQLQGSTPTDYLPISSFASIRGRQAWLMLDDNDSTFYTSGQAQTAGAWIGLDLRDVRTLREIKLLQGRNSVDDVDYFDAAVLECSVDGHSWTPLTPPLKQQYDIHWQGQPTEARYVRLRRLDSKRTNYASIRSFVVNPFTAADKGLEGTHAEQAVRVMDGRLDTAFPLRSVLSMTVPQATKQCHLLMGRDHHRLTVEERDAKGKLLASHQVTTSMASLSLQPKTKKLVLQGEADLVEVVWAKK